MIPSCSGSACGNIQPRQLNKDLLHPAWIAPAADAYPPRQQLFTKPRSGSYYTGLPGFSIAFNFLTIPLFKLIKSLFELYPEHFFEV